MAAFALGFHSARFESKTVKLVGRYKEICPEGYTTAPALAACQSSACLRHLRIWRPRPFPGLSGNHII